jgi:hypothetical protein
MTVSDKLKFKFEDDEYEFMSSLKVKDAVFLKDKCGATTATVVSYLDRRDPETIAAVAFLHARAAGKAVRYEDYLEKDIYTFDWIMPNVERCAHCEGKGFVVTVPEEAEEPGEDPTSRGKTPKGGTSKTATS